LRALIYRPTGGIVAAVTTSLPESIGGVRNWDYRYCWLRDATLTLLALANGGYFHEAIAWQDWLLRALAGSPEQVQIMYGLKGERQLVEWDAAWLSGYENSQPVRIGNAASTQVQLDIFGEVMNCFYHAHRTIGRHTEDDFRVLLQLLAQLETIWRHLGGARRAPAIHLFEDDGVGRLRSRRATGRSAPLPGAGRKMEGNSRNHSSRNLRKRVQRKEKQLHAGLWLQPA
jgi:hypothetical protein